MHKRPVRLVWCDKLLCLRIDGRMFHECLKMVIGIDLLKSLDISREPVRWRRLYGCQRMRSIDQDEYLLQDATDPEDAR